MLVQHGHDSMIVYTEQKQTGTGPEKSLFSSLKRLNAVRLPMLVGRVYPMRVWAHEMKPDT